MEAVTLYVTAASREEALSIARSLVAEGLAACGNLLEGVTSVYFWEGELREDAECALLLKTRRDLVEAAVQRIQQLHSYDCPCVVAWPAIGGNPAYLDWIAQQTRAAKEE